MEIFRRRYLCFFAFLFMFVSVCLFSFAYTPKLSVVIILAVLGLVGIVAAIFIKKHRFVLCVGAVALLFCVVAAFNSFVFISVPQSRAENYISDSVQARVRILSCEYSDQTSSEYLVRIEKIDEDEPDIKAYLYCDFPSELDYGDKMISTFKISQASDYVNKQGDILLTLSINEDAPVYYKEAESVNYFSADGIMHICRTVREAFGEYVDSIFGESSALVKGFLIDDRSDIPLYVQSDFKRSGTTHLLAVSGMHIVVLLGSVEIILRKIYVPKKIRFAVISLAALLLLMLTDFSGSAVRSVIMLYCVYVSYLFYEDHDTLTALFVSVFLIILISPYSVCDIGMWMSFCATFGLLILYSYIDRKLPRIQFNKTLKSLILKLALALLRAALITVVANLFLLPIMWLFFGEISLSALPANLLLSPIVTVFMPFCAIGVIIGAIPGLSVALIYIARIFEYAILELADLFANMRGAVLSLQYPFAKWLIIAFSISMAVLLVIKLKRKIFLCLPPVLFVASFVVCLTVFSLTSTPELRHAVYDDDQMFFFDDVDQSYVCDVTNGGYDAKELFENNKNPYATEIENYVIVDISKRHAYAIEHIMYDTYIRTLYIPIPKTAEDIEYAEEICSVADKYGTRIKFYEGKNGIILFRDLISEYK